jgi:hypothetical protein
MKLAKTMAIGAAALGMATGAALAQEETMLLPEPVEVVIYDVYGIDEDRDGVIDSYLLLEESDTLA